MTTRPSFLLSCILFAAASSVGFAENFASDRFAENDNWWRERAAVFFPSYQLTLQTATYSVSANSSALLGAAGTPDSFTMDPPVSAPDAILATSTWTGATNSVWATSTNWTGGTPTSTSDVIFSGTPTNFPDQPAGTTVLRSITFSAGAASYTGLNTATEIFGLANGTTFTAFSQASSNLQTLNELDVYFTGATANQNAIIDVSGSGGLVLTNLHWGLGASTQQFIIQGPGSATINGDFRGDLTTAGANGGTARSITLNGDATSGQTVTFNPTSGATWGSLTGIVLGGRVTLNIGNAAAIDAGTVTFASGAANSSLVITGVTSGTTFSRNFSFTAGSLTGGTQTLGVDLPGSGSATFSGTIAMAGSGNTVALSAGTADTATFSGVISGSRPMLVTGGGTVVLTNTGNTQSGGTTIDSATTLQISDVTAAAGNLGTNGTTAVIKNGSTLEFTGATQANTGSYAMSIGTGGGSIKITSAGTTLDLNNAGATANMLTGAGDFTKTGLGTLKLTASNNYSGATSINQGTLNFAALNNLGSGTAVNFGGGTLQYASSNTADISGRTVTINSGGATIDTGANIVTYSNAIGNSGTGALTKIGAGTLTLSGSNSYTGGTNINGGTVNVAGSLSTGAVILTNSSSTLSSGASSSIGGSVTANTGTFITPGGAAAVGQLTLGGLVLNNGSTLNFDFTSSASFDTILLGGNALTLSGSETLNVAGTTFSAGTFSLLTYGSQGGAGTLSLGTVTGGNSGSFTFNLTVGSTATTLTITAAAAGGNIWDANGATAGSGNTGGNWSDAKWTSDAAGSTATTNFANNSTPTFSAGTDGTGPFTINIDTAVNASGIAFEEGDVTLAHASGGSLTLTAATVSVASGATGTISEVIGGTVGLTKTGTGTLVLSGANTFSGVLAVQTGILSIGTINDASTNGVLGNSATSVVLGSSGATGTLEYTGSTASSTRPFTMATSGTGVFQIDTGGTTLTLSGVIDGSGILDKTGAGTLALSGTNTYTGATLVDAGTLSTTGANKIADTSAVTVASAATLALGGAETVASIAGAGNITLGGSFALTAGGNNSSTIFSGMLSGATGSLVKTGSGMITLSGDNSGLGGGITLSTGTLAMGSANALGTGTLALNAGTFQSSDATARTITNALTIGGNVTLGAAATGALTFNGATDLGAATRTLVLNSNAKFVGSVSNGGISKSGSGLLEFANASNPLTSLAITGGTAQIDSGAQITLTNGALSTSGGTTLTISGTLLNNSTTALNSQSGTVTVASGGTVIQQNTGSPTAFLFTGTVPATFQAGSTFIFRDYTASPSVSGRTYTGNLTFDSSGGAVTVGSLAGAGAWAVNGNLTIDSNIVFNYGTYSGTQTVGGDLTIGSSASVNFGTGNPTTNYNGNVSVSGTLGLTNSARSFTIGSGKTLTVANGGLINIASGQTVTVGAGGIGTINGTIGGAGAFTNAGTTTFTGVNTYAGDTTISGGTLKLGAANVIPDGAGKGNVSVTGTLDLNTFSETINGLSGAGTVDTVAGGTPTLTVGNNNQTSTFSGVIQNTAGALSLTKTGSGTLTLSGANTYSGGTALSVGTLNINNASAIGTGTFAISGGTTIDNTSAGAITLSTNNNQNWNGNFTFTGTKDLNLGTGNVGLNGADRTVTVTNSTATLTVGGVIGDAAVSSATQKGAKGPLPPLVASGIRKLGTGTLILSGTNAYTGTTVVSAGKLLINGDNSGATGAVSVNNAGTVLGGTGTIGGAVTVGSNAIILGGTGAAASGSLTLASTVDTSAGIIELALGAAGTHSTLAQTGGGAWTFGATQSFAFVDLGGTTGTYDNIITGLAGDPGTEGAWTIITAGMSGTFSFDGTNIDLNLTAIPEPSTWIGGSLALATLLLTQRRRLVRLLKRA